MSEHVTIHVLFRTEGDATSFEVERTALMPRVPCVGESVEWNGYAFRVAEVEFRRDRDDRAFGAHVHEINTCPSGAAVLSRGKDLDGLWPTL